MSRLISHHWNDQNGNPEGGQTSGVGLTIAWQRGPLGRPPNRKEPNGAFVEDVIMAAVDRIQFYQKSPFACRENALALNKLQEALHWLEERTKGREERGVEGTYEQ